MSIGNEQFLKTAKLQKLMRDPVAVLALIAENERLKTLRSTTERDLAQELEVWRHGPSCWNCGDTGDVHDIVGEWRGKCDCNAAKLIDVSSDRDQLRAEVAGLKTGYEAYEQTVKELRAEVEALREDAERYRWLQHGRSGYIEVVEWIGPHATGMTGEDLDALIDTAMGKGVQS
ncbi:hypothetical protein [Pseudomonas fluorescens]|uniref:hypothetical protein n=1 Tax=Pseudomonas fluorescens TaxID=294 RepID=UPI000641FBC6|nr:hypothetical protein [Pseudomonas fluorescens]